jgi:hypothetical protein
MSSVNENLAERVLSRSISLERLKAGEVKTLLPVLGKLERELTTALLNTPMTRFKQSRFDALLGRVRELIRVRYKTLRDRHQKNLEDLADLESTWTVRAINGATSEPIGVYVDIASISWTAEQLKAIASEAVIDAAPSHIWWAKQATDLRTRFEREVRTGLLKAETTEELIRRVRGTAANGFRDGVMEASRRQAEALVRTSVQSVAASARRQTFAANDDIIKALQQRSTLDLRTSSVCIAYSNKQWNDATKAPIGHPLPYNHGVPRHWNCRSAEIVITKSWSELLGVPLKMADDKTLDTVFRDKLRAMGWKEDRVRKAMLNVQSSMDGTVSADVDYQTWLRRKPAAALDAVLGKGKAALFRQGVIRDIDLVDFSGNPLTLQQLREEFGAAA